MNLKFYTPMVAGLLMLSACSQSASKGDNDASVTTEGIVNFEVKQTIKTLDRTYACKGASAVFDDSIPVFSVVRMAVQWPEKMGDCNIKVLQDSLLSMMFDDPAINIDESMVRAGENPEGADLFTMQPIDSLPNEGAMVYMRDMISSVVTFSRHYVVYEVLTSVYDGGAHGLTNSRYLTYDLDKGRVIDANVMFKPDSGDALLKAIKSELMADNGVSTLKELDAKGFFSDQIYVSHNVYLQGYDVVFHYNPYEIAPYSEGSVDVRIPFYEISDQLTPEVLNIFNTTDF